MNRENSIEWLTGQDRITVSLTQKRYITRVKKLAKQHENQVDFIENEDGSIIAHLPLTALKLSIITGREMSEEEKEERAEVLKRWREEQSKDISRNSQSNGRTVGVRE